jgi:3-dehydroquinate dehydratase/shikimate dehydrogenase
LDEVFSSDLTGADCAEVRLDYLDRPQESIHARWDRLPLPVIATCRGKERGGRFEGSIEDETRILQCAVENGAEFVDIDYRLAKSFEGARVIASFHDFLSTPPDIDSVVDDACAGPGQIAKVATFVNSWTDNRRLLSVLSRKWPKPVIVVGMGEVGQITRVIGPSRGSFLTYASLMSESAPGQLSLSEMLDIYRFRRVKSSTEIVGIIGMPIGDSPDLEIHNRAFAATDLDFAYLKLPVTDLKDFFDNARALGIVGFSVTIPHEAAVISFLDRLTTEARDAGVVNVVSLQDEEWIGDIVFDMVYNPPTTRLLRSARDQGKTVIRGTAMFLAQAARQFEIWTGHRAPSEIFEEKSGLS